MTRLLAGFVAAILAASVSSSVPAGATLTAIGAGALAALVLGRIPLIGGALLGIALAGGAARDALDHRIASCVDASVVEVRGAIVGLPRGSGPQVQFDVEPENAAPWPACGGPLPRRLRLSWFAGAVVAPGEIWQLRIKLRSVRGYQNPGGFDYEAWSLANHIDGGGSVRYAQRLASAPRWSWDRLRLLLRERFAQLPAAHAGILLALLTGDGALMADSDWALFRATGTVHLMVISGLHLTIVVPGRAGSGMGCAFVCCTRREWTRPTTTARACC